MNVPYETIPDGDHFLARHGPRWAMWHKKEHNLDRLLVSASGAIITETSYSDAPWHSSPEFYMIDQTKVTGAVMAARHLSEEGWQRFCARLAEHGQ